MRKRGAALKKLYIVILALKRILVGTVTSESVGRLIRSVCCNCLQSFPVAVAKFLNNLHHESALQTICTINSEMDQVDIRTWPGLFLFCFATSTTVGSLIGDPAAVKNPPKGLRWQTSWGLVQPWHCMHEYPVQASLSMWILSRSSKTDITGFCKDNRGEADIANFKLLCSCVQVILVGWRLYSAMCTRSHTPVHVNAILSTHCSEVAELSGFNVCALQGISSSVASSYDQAENRPVGLRLYALHVKVFLVFCTKWSASQERWQSNTCKIGLSLTIFSQTHIMVYDQHYTTLPITAIWPLKSIVSEGKLGTPRKPASD